MAVEQGRSQSAPFRKSDALCVRNSNPLTGPPRIECSLGATDGAQNDDDEDREGTPGNLADLIALRKLRQSTRTQGIEIEKLNAGLKTKKKKRKQVDAAPADEETYGLQKRKGAQDEDRCVRLPHQSCVLATGGRLILAICCPVGPLPQRR